MTVKKQKTAIIAGAGPAGLTAGYELLKRTDIKPVILECSSDIGGISKTVNYKGNKIDIGGHRFFSKSDRVTQFWLNILPPQTCKAVDDILLERKLPSLGELGINYPDKSSNSKSTEADPEKNDKVMLFRRRISRIYFLRKFFDYPISLSLKTISNLGLIRLVKIAVSYLKICIAPIKEEKSLEDFFINRFGRELYLTFFKDYTEKVWGISCDKIKPEWGAQRIKGLSIRKAILQSLKNIFCRDRSLSQKNTETTLINQFLYPKFGPGQLWEQVAEIIRSKGGEIIFNHEVNKVTCCNNRICEIQTYDKSTGGQKNWQADYFFSSMPVKHLIRAMGEKVPAKVKETAEGLIYRDFITAGLLVRKLKIKNETSIKTVNNIIPDNWIYIQEKEVRLGRLQIFNNWSPYMVKDPDTIWLGLEYFCDSDDEFWNRTDTEIAETAADELNIIGIVDKDDILDKTVIRMPMTYPAYFGSYDNFDVIKSYVNKFENLFLIGRNGMHKYNNQDHSMLTAMTAVDNIINGINSKDNIWSVNTEQSYHENK